MALSATTPQATVETAREALITAERALERYIQVNNPGLLAIADAALTAAKTAITNVQA